MNTHQPHISHPKYRPDIDGLRAVAVLAVVFYHAFPDRIKGGFIGVDIFFTISGYLISTIIYESLENGSFSFTEFYSRRIKRIFPALIIVLVSCFAFGWFALLADEFKQLGKHIAAGAAFVSNLVLWNESGYFDNASETKPLLHLWSLGVEEQFYIIWPFLLWLAHKMRLNLLIVGLIIALGSFYINIQQVETNAVADFYSPLTRFWELMFGSILAWISIKKTPLNSEHATEEKKRHPIAIFNNLIKDNGQTIANASSLFALFIIFYGFWRIDKNIGFPGKWALIPTLGASILIYTGPNGWINRNLLSNKITVWFGLISFPLYLWHWPLLSFARIVESETPSLNVRALAVVLSIVLAWLTYRFVERPIRFGNHSKAKVTTLLFLMAIIGYVGYNTYARDGYEFRHSIKNLANNKNELVRTPEIDADCLKYTKIEKPLFHYCRFTNVDSSETVAVIGDSHAHVAYPGIAEYLKNKGINTVLLANSSCPPFIGSYTGTNQSEKDACKDRIEQLLKTVISHKDIKKVFVFTRGPIYNTGTEPVTGNKYVLNFTTIPTDKFVKSAQVSFDLLAKSGKSAFYVTENPELGYNIESCLGRPFKSSIKNCSAEKNAVFNRQTDYLSAINSLKNVVVINSLNAFCPQDTCVVFDSNGSLLYADDDHLSIAGSRYQVNTLLREFLD